MTLFRLDASIRTEGSHSRAVADIVENEWRQVHGDEPVIRRQVGLDPIPSTTWATAVLGSRTPEESRTPEQSRALGMAARLTDELVTADALLFAVPLYNFGVSQHFKTWVDLVITDPRMSAGSAPLLAHKPAILVVARGGSYGTGTPREGWDHATGWIQRILSDVWQLDLATVEAEFTQLGVNPRTRAVPRDRRAPARRDGPPGPRTRSRARARSHRSPGPGRLTHHRSHPSNQSGS